MVAALAAVALGFFGAVPASAATTADGQRWYDTYGVAAVQADGWTGAGVKVAVIDTQINPGVEALAGADITVAPGSPCVGFEPTGTSGTAQHGSNMAAFLVGNGTGPAQIRGIVPDASLTFYSLGPNDCQYTDEVDASGLSQLGWSVQRAVADGARVVSMSFGAGSTVRDDQVIADAVARGVVLVASVQNDTLNVQGSPVPAAFNGVVSVNAVDRDGQLQITPGLNVPNVQEDVTVVAPGVDISVFGSEDGDWNVAGTAKGSSISTALVAGIIVAAAQKFPKATGNQLLQALLHTTNGGQSDFTHQTNGYGYGIASLRFTLDSDPLSYDDANPLLDKGGPNRTPTQADFEEARAALAAASPTEQPNDDPAAGGGFDDASIAPVLIGVGIGGLIVIVAAVVLTIFLVRRNNRSHREGQS